MKSGMRLEGRVRSRKRNLSVLAMLGAFALLLGGLLGALLARTDGDSAAARPEPAAAASAAGRTDDYVVKRLVVEDSWRSLRRDAEAFGVSRLYGMDGDSPFKYGPHDGIWYVGTYERDCLISVGYPNAYTESPLRAVPRLSVQVFNRYGGSRYLDANDSIAYEAVKKFVARSAARCR